MPATAPAGAVSCAAPRWRAEDAHGDLRRGAHVEHDGTNSAVMAVPVTGGEPSIITSSEGLIEGLWADAIGLVWTTQSPPKVWHLAR